MNKKFFKHIISVSAAAFAYTFILTGNPAITEPVPGNNSKQESENPEDESNKPETENEPGISPLNDDETYIEIQR